jgi:hypothetical protein
MNNQPEGTDHCGSVPHQPGYMDPAKSKRILLVLLLVVLGVAGLFLSGTLGMIFVFGGSCDCARVVSARAVQPDNGTIVVTYLGGQDAKLVTGMNVTVQDSAGKIQPGSIGTMEPADRPWFPVPGPAPVSPLPAGRNLSFTGNYSGRDRVVAMVRYTDATYQIILDSAI